MLPETQFNLGQTVQSDGSISFKQVNLQFTPISLDDPRVELNEDGAFLILKMGVDFISQYSTAPAPIFTIDGNAVKINIAQNISQIAPESGEVTILVDPTNSYTAYSSSVFMNLANLGTSINCTVYSPQSVLESWYINEFTASIEQNTTDIATNKSSIAQNTTDIATNKSSIAQNTTDISTLQDSTDIFMLKFQKTGISQEILEGATFNLISLLTMSDVVASANLTNRDFSITDNNLIFANIDDYVDYSVNVRLSGTIDGASVSDCEFGIDLQRADGTSIEKNIIIKVAGDSLDNRSQIFSTYTIGATDPFIESGAKIIIDNPNTTSNNLTLTGYEILVKGRV